MQSSVLLVSIVACQKPVGPDNGNPGGSGGETVEIPEPPENIIEENLFNVDFFSALDDEPFFETRSVDVAAEHIQEQNVKRPLMYFFDRADYEIGKSSPAARIALDVKKYSCFAQNTLPSSNVEGTGIVTTYPVTYYDGMFAEGKYFMSGCRIKAPLGQPTDVCIYTARIESLEHIKAVFGSKYDIIHYDGIIVGAVNKNAEVSVSEYIAKEGGAVRYMTYDVDGKDYAVFVIVPASFVCRRITGNTKVNLPYYRISIEKLI